MKRLRQSTVEPVFGSLVQYYGLNKINVLGKQGAHKNMLMAAIAFNVKKYLKTTERKIVISATKELSCLFNSTQPALFRPFSRLSLLLVVETDI